MEIEMTIPMLRSSGALRVSGRLVVSGQSGCEHPQAVTAAMLLLCECRALIRVNSICTTTGAQALRFGGGRNGLVSISLCLPSVAATIQLRRIMWPFPVGDNPK